MIRRRELLGTAPGLLASCATSSGAYFGDVTAPKTARLVHILNGDVESLDPAKSTGSHEFYVLPALFEGLMQYHPAQPVPMAALATHYEVNATCTEYRFYLRGHRAPRGTRLPTAADLPERFTRGQAIRAETRPALWSDGRPITADDFVYSWRRFVDPKTAALLNFQFSIVKHASGIMAGKLPPSALGVEATDAFTFVVHLELSCSFFLEFITSYVYAAVPMHVVEAARRRNAESTWTTPQHIVTSGAFTLQDYRASERIVLNRNIRYYDASLVGLDELTFIPVTNGAAVMNLYRIGEATLTPGLSLPPVFAPILSQKKDYHATQAFGTIFQCISTRKAPFDNVLLRYALNMATDKKAASDFLGPGYAPARSLVAPLAEYRQTESLPVQVEGRVYDVLSFDVEGARSLLARSGFPDGIGADGRRLEVTHHFPNLPEARPKAEILQQQWLRHLGIRVKLVQREFNVHWRMVLESDYHGMADYAAWPLYLDPNGFLDQFATDSNGNPCGWSDTAYVAELTAANATLDRSTRLKRLATCERRLLTAMPFLPFYHAAWGFLCKPFVRGFEGNLFDVRAFKYVWIDPTWRSQ